MQRRTRQREAIQEVFRDHDRPLRPEQVHEHARRRCPGLGMATVYRTLKSLLEAGWLVGLSVPDVGRVYERAHKGHHHHFCCRRCGEVYEFPGCPLDERAVEHEGFRVDGHELFLFGLCRRCRPD
jgi:Fur family ferric uptake transcriptional regulator